MTLLHPLQMRKISSITPLAAIFLCVETVEVRTVWGFTIAHPDLTGKTSEHLLRAAPNSEINRVGVPIETWNVREEKPKISRTAHTPQIQ